MSRILVTGSEGTLGTKLVSELKERGHEVYGADLMHGEDGLYRTDVSIYRQVERTFEKLKPEIVYHLAAEFGRNNGQDFPEQLWTNNAIGTRNMVDACIKHDAHLIFASSSEAYGDVADGGELLEESLKYKVPRFHNEYALSKWTNERQIEIAQKNQGLRATILRFFNAYGPGEYYSAYRSVVCLFIYRLMHDQPITVYKNYHRVFMYVDDWARTVANLTNHTDGRYEGQIFNIGGTEYCSVEELVDKLLKLLGGSKSVITTLDKELANITNKRPNVDRAIQLLNHNPSITLDEGLPLTIDWHRKVYGL